MSQYGDNPPGPEQGPAGGGNQYGSGPYGDQGGQQYGGQQYGGQQSGGQQYGNQYGGQQYGNQYGGQQYGNDNPYAQGGYGQAATRGPRPRSVDLAIKLIYANVALGIVSTLVQFLFLDSMIDEQLAGAGVALSQDAVRTTVIVSILVGLVISVGIAVLFAVFIGKGANWARIVYTVLSALGIVFGLIGLGSLPAIPLLLSVVGYAITVAALVMLYRPDSNAWFAGR